MATPHWQNPAVTLNLALDRDLERCFTLLSCYLGLVCRIHVS